MVYGLKNQIVTKIEKAADEYVFSYGIRGWNMDDCAREAGITKRTLYRYVHSKEELVENVLKRFIRSTQKNLMNVLGEEKEYLKGMNEILRIFPGMIMKMNSKIIQSIFKDYPNIEKHIIEERLSLAAETLNFINRGQSEGFFKKDFDAQTILEILQSLVIYYMNNNPSNFEDKLKDSFSLVLNGIREK